MVEPGSLISHLVNALVFCEHRPLSLLKCVEFVFVRTASERFTVLRCPGRHRVVLQWDVSPSFFTALVVCILVPLDPLHKLWTHPRLPTFHFMFIYCIKMLPRWLVDSFNLIVDELHTALRDHEWSLDLSIHLLSLFLDEPASCVDYFLIEHHPSSEWLSPSRIQLLLFH